MIENKRQRVGFTLIELLIVVAIIGILAAIAIPNFLEAQTRAKVSRCVSDMRSCGLAIEMYALDNNELPLPPGWQDYENYKWFCGFLDVTNNTTYNFAGRMLTSPVAYMSSVPMDFFNSAFFIVQDNSYWAQIADGEKCSFVMSGLPMKADRSSTMVPWVNQMGPHMPKTFRFVLESAGPDLKWWGPTWESFFYDPTNGTISDGQILYFDGGRIWPH